MARPKKAEEMVKLTISIPKIARKEARKAAAELEIGVGELIARLILSHTASNRPDSARAGGLGDLEVVPFNKEPPPAEVPSPKSKPKRQKDLSPRPPSYEWLEGQLSAQKKTPSDLSRFLEISPEAIYEWRQRRVIPQKRLPKILEFLKKPDAIDKQGKSLPRIRKQGTPGSSWEGLIARLKAVNLGLSDLASHIEVPFDVIKGWEKKGQIPPEYVGPIDRILTELE